MAELVHEVLEETVQKFGDKPALRAKRDGVWRTMTWRAYGAAARKAARALMHLGMSPGTGASIIGANSPEWVIANTGAILAGGMPAGIYTTNSAEQVRYITDHCDAAVSFADTPAQVKKFLEVKDQLPKLKVVVQMAGKVEAQGNGSGPRVISWDEFLAAADEVPEEKLTERLRAQKPDDCCTLIYTSGTTGDPKAVMITHTNVVWTARTTADHFFGKNGDEVILSYLPLSHIAEQMMTIHGPMALGGLVYFAESLEKLGENLAEVRPTIFLGVPRVWEKIQAKMVAAGAAAPPLRKKIAAWARKVGLAAGYADQRGEKKPLSYAIADKIVYSKVRQKLGLDRARICVTSAAPISKDTLEFFLSLGIPIMEIYGMSECTGPATFSFPHAYKTGKVGQCMPGAELKLAEDGEICMRGKHVFKGYFKNEAATKEALDADGWLHSGDIGTLDGQKFLQITDRKKDLLITAGGENIAPQVLEGMLKAIPVVAQAVVVGDRMKYLAALLTLDADRVATEAAACGSSAKDVTSAAKDPTFRRHLDKQIDEYVNTKVARVQTIKKFVVLPNELSIEGGELTPTMKVKRKVVNQKYATEIASMYDEPAAAQATA